MFTVSPADWNRQVKREFDALMAAQPEDDDDDDAPVHPLQEMLEWHEDATANELIHLKSTGKTRAAIGKYVLSFISLVCLFALLIFFLLLTSHARKAKRAHEDIGVHFFGYGIDDDGVGSVMWGGTDEYGQLRKKYLTSINGQLKDYEAMFR